MGALVAMFATFFGRLTDWSKLLILWGAGSTTGRVLMSLGVSTMTFTGMTAALGAMKTYINNTLAGLPLAMYQIATMLGVTAGISMLFAALTARMVWAGMSASGAMTKWATGKFDPSPWKAPPGTGDSMKNF